MLLFKKILPRFNIVSDPETEVTDLIQPKSSNSDQLTISTMLLMALCYSYIIQFAYHGLRKADYSDIRQVIVINPSSAVFISQ